MTHCATCTCPPESTGEFCDSTAKRAHETFTCLSPDGHDGPHGGMDGGWPICPACDGVDGGDPVCGHVASRAVGGVHVTWDDDGNVTVKEWTP